MAVTYELTWLVFGINIVALVDGQPKLINLKELLECFIKHRRAVVTRRTVYLLRKARERGHILEGWAIALANIDAVIALIKGSPTPAEAKTKLMSESWVPGSVLDMLDKQGGDVCRPDDLPENFGLKDGRYYLSPAQAQAILDLRLHRLTGMEHEKLLVEYKERLAQIVDFLEILSNPERLLSVIRDELVELVDNFGWM